MRKSHLVVTFKSGHTRYVLSDNGEVIACGSDPASKSPVSDREDHYENLAGKIKFYQPTSVEIIDDRSDAY